MPRKPEFLIAARFAWNGSRQRNHKAKEEWVMNGRLFEQGVEFSQSIVGIFNHLTLSLKRSVHAAKVGAFFIANVF